jgi:hypothetical protein
MDDDRGASKAIQIKIFYESIKMGVGKIHLKPSRK